MHAGNVAAAAVGQENARLVGEAGGGVYLRLAAILMQK